MSVHCIYILVNFLTNFGTYNKLLFMRMPKKKLAFLHTLAIFRHQIHKLSLQAPKLGEGGDKDA